MGSCWTTLGPGWCILVQDGIMKDHVGITMSHLGASLASMGPHGESMGPHGQLLGHPVFFGLVESG